MCTTPFLSEQIHLSTKASSVITNSQNPPQSNQHYKNNNNSNGYHQTVSFQTGKKIKTATQIVAKIAPPTKLCNTIFLCSLLRYFSLTRSLLSKIINLDTDFKKPPSFLKTLSVLSSNLSHGSLCLLENNKRKKQLPRRPARMSETPSHQLGHAAQASHRVWEPR